MTRKPTCYIEPPCLRATRPPSSTISRLPAEIASHPLLFNLSTYASAPSLPLVSALSSFSSSRSGGCLSAPTHPGAPRSSRALWRSSAKSIPCPSAAIYLDGMRRKREDGMRCGERAKRGLKVAMSSSRRTWNGKGMEASSREQRSALRIRRI